jgi:hypothetical protein
MTMIIDSWRILQAPVLISKNNMTAASDGGYVASADNNYTNYNPFDAFDGSLNYGAGNCWLEDDPATHTGWLQQQLPVAKIATKYIIKASDNVALGSPPSAWTFLGSNNGSDFTTLDTRTGQTGWANSDARTFLMPGNMTPYLYYRINITADDGGTRLCIGELEIYGY